MQGELKDLLLAEAEQGIEEGCEKAIVEKIKEGIEVAKALGELKRLERELSSLRPREGFSYIEPEGLEGIRAERPDGPRSLGIRLDEDELRNRLLGAWLGRCIGCMVGKPVEGWPKERIEELLRQLGEWPLSGYFPEAEGLQLKEALRGKITKALQDDDLDYTALNLHILETHGPSGTTEYVAREWLDHLPYHGVHTAERATYRNLVLGLRPPEVTRFRNPYREWVGAGIRADIYGYISPGLRSLPPA